MRTNTLKSPRIILRSCEEETEEIANVFTHFWFGEMVISVCKNIWSSFSCWRALENPHPWISTKIEQEDERMWFENTGFEWRSTFSMCCEDVGWALRATHELHTANEQSNVPRPRCCFVCYGRGAAPPEPSAAAAQLTCCLLIGRRFPELQ